MGTIFVEGWKYGMDRRRQRVAGVKGTLWRGRNIVISRGGDIERAKRFVPTFTLPGGQTFGLGVVRNQIFVFGSAPAPAIPVGVQYQQLTAPSGAPMTQVLSVAAAGGKMYVIASFADGNIFHFYNGARITDWDAVADANTDFPTTATALANLISSNAAVSAQAVGASITITALVPGTPFTISKLTTNFGAVNDQDIVLTTVQPNVPVVAEVQATSAVTILSGSQGAPNKITNISVNGVPLMLAPVPYTLDNPTTLAAVAVQINNLNVVHGYLATASGSTLTITAPPGAGAAQNNFPVTSIVGGNVILSTPSMSGGVTASAGVAQVVTATLIGTFESPDFFQITINGSVYSTTGRAAGTGTSTFISNRRNFSAASSLLEYSALNTFNDYHTSTPSSGAGFINVSNDAEGSEPLVGAGIFQQQMAVFSRRNIRIYNLSTDATAITLSQPIDNSGALAARSILGYGTTDLYYLDEPGIRSLSPRYATNAPFVNDIGVPLDPFIRAHINVLPVQTLQRACAVVEPLDGRFWLALDNRVYVLSYFPGSQISAWTYFEPGFSITDFGRTNNQLYARAGDTIYQYGGVSGSVYPNAGELIAQVELPFASGNPPNVSMMLGFDIAATGEWLVQAIVDANPVPGSNPVEPTWSAFRTVGTIDGITYGESGIEFPGRTALVAFNMTCSQAGNATISNLTLHTDGQEIEN